LLLTVHGVKIKRSKSVLDPERVKEVLSRLTDAERTNAIKGLGLLASASELQMKSKSFEGAWAKRENRNNLKTNNTL